jgi:hypothetical protein
MHESLETKNSSIIDEYQKNSAGRESEKTHAGTLSLVCVSRSRKKSLRERKSNTDDQTLNTDIVWHSLSAFSTQENNVSGFECFRGRQNVHCSKNGKIACTHAPKMVVGISLN